MNSIFLKLRYLFTKKIDPLQEVLSFYIENKTDSHQNVRLFGSLSDVIDTTDIKVAESSHEAVKRFLLSDYIHFCRIKMSVDNREQFKNAIKIIDERITGWMSQKSITPIDYKKASDNIHSQSDVLGLDLFIDKHKYLEFVINPKERVAIILMIDEMSVNGVKRISLKNKNWKKQYKKSYKRFHKDELKSDIKQYEQLNKNKKQL